MFGASSVKCMYGPMCPRCVMSVTFLPSQRELLGDRDAHEVPVVVDDERRFCPGTSLPSPMSWSGVRMYGFDASAPGIVSWVQPLRPFVAQ